VTASRQNQKALRTAKSPAGGKGEGCVGDPGSGVKAIVGSEKGGGGGGGGNGGFKWVQRLNFAAGNGVGSQPSRAQA